jgi:hypothetical protein
LPNRHRSVWLWVLGKAALIVLSAYGMRTVFALAVDGQTPSAPPWFLAWAVLWMLAFVPALFAEDWKAWLSCLAAAIAGLLLPGLGPEGSATAFVVIWLIGAAWLMIGECHSDTLIREAGIARLLIGGAIGFNGYLAVLDQWIEMGWAIPAFLNMSALCALWFGGLQVLRTREILPRPT